ncbi:MAG TPA: methylated-DNA--[protein]-cysteine S-methyltransferase [Gammaproteobacteria bacterium]|nr:methylated-DNA--[protein]-cysteine S-methyltransferase [Gammaproteobacteria bacterium]
MRANRKLDWPRILLDACRRIERGAGGRSLAELAAQAGVSAFELQRQFKRRLGVSPKAYAQALALHRLTQQAARERSALAAAFAAGFESAATAYATAGGALGTTPGGLRRPLEIGWWMGLSDLGWMLMAATRRGICWLAFGDAPGALLEELRAAFPKARFHNDAPRLVEWFERVREFVLLPREALDLPVDVQGTAFQARVWRALRRIPLGTTASYGELAKRLGRPEASRAVAAACARNRVALLIPCHRVVAADGRLAGYRWGIERKAVLLGRETGVER